MLRCRSKEDCLKGKMDSKPIETIWVQKSIRVSTRGRGTYDVTRQVASSLVGSGMRIGLCHIFVQHTSASLILCENADPVVRKDLERFMQRTAPDGDPIYRHRSEGVDDMPAHVRSVLTNVAVTVPVMESKLALGIWQSIYLWEHRLKPHSRDLVITLQGIT